MEVIKFKCGHAIEIVDSNGITEHIVVFEMPHNEIKKFHDWQGKKDVRQIEVTDDSGLFESKSGYRCVNVRVDYGHAVIELGRE